MFYKSLYLWIEIAWKDVGHKRYTLSLLIVLDSGPVLLLIIDCIHLHSRDKVVVIIYGRGGDGIPKIART